MRVFQHLTGIDRLKDWAKRLIDDLNSRDDYVAGLPAYDDDAAAEAARLPVNHGYRAPDGTVRWRSA